MRPRPSRSDVSPRSGPPSAVHARVRPWFGALLCCLMFSAGVPVPAQNSNDRKARALSPTERVALNQLETLSPEALQAMAGATAAAPVEARVREILASGSLYVGERSHDAEGLAPIHRYLLDALKAREGHGLRLLGTLRGEVPVPVEVHHLRADPAPAPSSVEVGGETLRVTPLWPNGPMPSLCPATGVRGRLVDIGLGEWPDLNGLDLQGAVVLMDFAGGRNWERALSLGAAAVIVLEDDRVIRDNAERLFMNTPVPMPRFFARKEIARRLRSLAKGGAGEAVLRGGALFENRPFTSLFAYLPPPTELPAYAVRPDDLLGRIAADHTIGIEDLRAANDLSAGSIPAGTVLKLPGGTKTYTVAPNDLLRRIASFHGITEEQLAAANPGHSGEPTAGQSLRIPHLDGPLLLARDREDGLSYSAGIIAPPLRTFWG